MQKPTIVLNDKVMDRFWPKVEKTESCWIWKGASTTSGHGRFKINGLMYGPHRIMYELNYGPIPQGLYICHKCPCGDNPSCCNPEHLYAGTPSQNCQDEVRKQRTRHFTATNASKYYGVRYDSNRKNWISYVYVDRKLNDIGRHSSEIDAARNYDRIIAIKYQKMDRLNFPNDYGLSS